MMQIVQELCKRPGLNRTGFDMPTIYIPNPNKVSNQPIIYIPSLNKVKKQPTIYIPNPNKVRSLIIFS